MSTATIIDSSDASPGLLYDCPQGATSAGWIQWTNSMLRGGSGMYTRGNGCYMQYTFQGTSVVVYTVPNLDRGIYSCTIDNYPTRWFIGFSGAERFNVVACSVTGLQDGQHTIRLTNGPLHTWILPIDWISVERSVSAQPGASVTITSQLPPYELPSFSSFVPSISNTTSIGTTQDSSPSSTSTSTSSPTSTATPGVASGVVIGVAVGLSVLALSAFVLAGFFLRQNRKLRVKLQKHSMDQASSAPHTIQPFSPSSNTNTRASPLTALSTTPIGITEPTPTISEYNPYASTVDASSSGLSYAPPRYSSPSPVPRRKL